MNYFEYMASYISGGGIVKLADFACKMDGIEGNFNDVAMLLIMASLQSGGGIQTATVEDIDNKLQKHISSMGNIRVQTNVEGVITNSSPTVSYDHGMIVQASVGGVLNNNGLYYEFATHLWFSTNSTRVTLWCKATPFV